MNGLEALRSAMVQVGIVFTDQFTANGQWQHFDCPNEKGKASIIRPTCTAR